MGIRVIKTAIAAILAIYAARYFQLEPALSAGILAILGVEVTRKQGLTRTAVRFVASVLGLALASIIFVLFGFYYWTVAIFILVSFPIMSRFQLKEGIVTSCVIVFHLYSYGEVTPDLILNEISLLFVGLGSATIINMVYMPKVDQEIMKLRQTIELTYYQIFYKLAMILRDPSYIWSGEELLKAYEAIEKGAAISQRSKENRLWNNEAYWSTYFEMRREQFESIEHMMEMVAYVHGNLEHSERVAELLEQLGRDTRSEVYVGEVKDKLQQLKVKFRAMELPKTRIEFETRASLLMLMHEMNRYLDVAERLKRKKETSDSD
ncbi:aromatic acid exporter family protein [Paenibacillus septentrionalis]|uniref:Aromatic acid exporter family protein n=1 Tax=Paenibacillus septentrionalis TaxID=429342 RepID=A0ABW1V416_9BACL